MMDSATREIKSFLFCAKTGDSSYMYRLYNRNTIIHETPNSVSSLTNGITLLGVFATFENTIHHQEKTVYPFPWTTVYKNAFISFGNNVSTTVGANGVKTIPLKGIPQQRVNTDCWVVHTQTVTYGFGEYGSVSFVMAWQENICTGELQIVGFSRVGGDTGGGSGSGGDPDPGPGEPQYYGGYYDGNPGGPYLGNYNPGNGGGGPGDPFNPPGSINDPTFGYPPPNTEYQTPPGSAQFYKQFLVPTEGADGDPYDAGYWDDPNLTMPTQTLPSWTTFKNAYPGHADPLYDTPKKMYESVGGTVLSMYNSNPAAYQNTCALRISKALNDAGITIPPGPGRFQGADGKSYFLGASTLFKWLKLTFGTPTGSNHLTGAQGGTNGINFPALLANKKGIYVMIPASQSQTTGFGASGHADIINNGECDGGCYFGAIGGVLDIFIWELP
jgi:hypothetical protein